jgi:uncharacterized protein (DUF488 family)
MPDLFLTGYEKESIDTFIKKLSSVNIDTIIDVREIPLSRKAGFSKKSLEKKLFSNKIKYYHFSKLGSPKKIRHALRSGILDYLEFFQLYQKYVRNQKESIFESLDIIGNNKKIGILCFEKETELCHRTILAEILSKYKQMRVHQL